MSTTGVKVVIGTNDFDDNKFVDCAISANAFCILSNDKHFSILNEISFPRVKVLTVDEFETAFKQVI
jgi:predicted nucleic acid-binding protein